jgi:aspartate beta-hydroxylase
VTELEQTEIRHRYSGLIDALNRLGRTDEARRCALLAVEQGLWRDPLQRPLEYDASLPPEPVHSPEGFWFVDLLESNAGRIRAELDAVTEPGAGGFLPVEEPLVARGRWDQVVLYEAGRRFDRACATFPVLAEVIGAIPEATTLGPGVVTLSWLHPGTRIAPHCGRTNARLRVHLGLRVPEEPRLRVGDEVLAWEQDRCLVFDDSFEHEVWHDGERERVVLLFDVLHPALDAAARDRILAGRDNSGAITRYLAERDIRRVELDGDEVTLRPTQGADSLIRRYLAEAGASAAELDGGGLRLE